MLMILTAGALAAMAGLAIGGQTSEWTHRLQWEHDGQNVSRFDVCINGSCQGLEASRVAGSDTWSAPLPRLPQGLNTVVVYACNETRCAEGWPTLSVNVQSSGSVSPGSGGTTAPPPAPPSSTVPAPGRKAPPRHPPKSTQPTKPK
jgi:ABC-type phosphate transport system substrate-binding protein